MVKDMKAREDLLMWFSLLSFVGAAISKGLDNSLLMYIFLVTAVTLLAVLLLKAYSKDIDDLKEFRILVESAKNAASPDIIGDWEYASEKEVAVFSFIRGGELIINTIEP